MIIIDRWFPSSKLCNVCGYKYKELSLKERQWTCPDCGTQHDRDFNAATNIKNEGQRILNNKIGTRYPEFTLVDYPTMDDRLNNKVLKSSDRMNQEEKSTNTNFL